MKKQLLLFLLTGSILFAAEGDFVRKKPKLMDTKQEEVKELPGNFKKLEDRKSEFKYKESDFKKEDSNFKKSDYSNMQKTEYTAKDFDYMKPSEDLKKKQDQSFNNVKNFFGKDYENLEKNRNHSDPGGGD